VQFTIERIRTAVVIAGALLIAALGVFLTIGRWKSPFNRRDLPKKLGIDIQRESNGFTQAEFAAGHAKFKITASRVEQLKDDRYRLHVVKIEMYDPNGAADRIEGSEFEYDQHSGIAMAAGPVEITLNRPQNDQTGVHKKPQNKTTDRDKTRTPTSASQDPAANQIHVRTSGLIFDQNTGVATTSEHVDFDLAQGSGSSMGASYDSQNGKLVLNRAVELNTHRGADPIRLQAQHAELSRDDNLCRLSSANARFRSGGGRAQQATILFRDDGSAEQLDASNGLELTTATGGHLTAPTGRLQFDEDNQPRLGHLEGGVSIDSDQADRKLHGTAPTAELQFDSQGLLRHAHLERKVNFASEQVSNSVGGPLRTHRNWASPIADLEFRNSGKGQVALDSIQGIEGVAVTSESQRGSSAVAHARMTADDVKGMFGADSTLSSMTGTGHAHIEQTTETGTRQITTGDRLEAHFTESQAGNPKPGRPGASTPVNGTQIESATVIGNVVLFQQPATKPGSPEPPALRATAERADYDGVGELLHLTGNPRVENGGLQLTANKIDVARASSDAFAHGDVKATWFGNEADPIGKQDAHSRTEQGPGLGTQGPAHVIAAEAQLHQQTGETTFRGHARLWQQANSVAAPVIALDRTRQTLVAQTANPAEPVRVVLLSATKPGQNMASKEGSPSIIRVRGGDLKYSAAERKAVMHGATLGTVVAETGDATTRSSELELTLLPPGNHAARDGGAAQVDRMTARGHVTIDSEGRQGTGDQLVYSSESGEYVLTGSAATPPRMTDPTRGTVTGGALIFNSRDDSVNVEGDGRATTTETTVPKRP
jgi:lipopolysaccharide export system protein LptA